MTDNEIHIQYPGNESLSASNTGRLPLPRNNV